MKSFHSVIIYINIFTKSVCIQFMFTVYSEAASLLIVSNDTTEFSSRPLNGAIALAAKDLDRLRLMLFKSVCCKC